MKTSNLLFNCCLFLCWATTAFGNDVTGRVQVVGDSGRDSSTMIVYAESVGEPSPVKPGRYTMVQRNKTFVPHVLAIPVGSTVVFPNSDPIFHNVFSLSSPAPFDLGLYRAGSSKSIVFTEPATYRVFCNIHPQMSALLVVVPTSWITQADAQGNYHLDLPPGRYRLTAWSERAQPASTHVTVESTQVSVPELTLDASKFVEVPHKNKYGRDYPQSAYDPTKR